MKGLLLYPISATALSIMTVLPVSASMVDMWFVIVPALNFPPLFAVIYAAPLGVVTNVLPAIA